MIVPDAPPEGARQRGQQLREATTERIKELRGQTLGRTTLLIAVATFPANDETGAALVEAAEAALLSRQKKAATASSS